MEERINHMEYLPGMDIIDSDVMDKVISAMEEYDYNKYTANDVRRALDKDVRTPEDFRALLSPAAMPFLEEMARKA
ncbi:MAG: 2-iminoacetate synthase ThiH, partial [Clostridium sp.]|nr:2-iminoacetate synthase ThiH [Clostridium sp.]